jgi:hypothetical protein
MPEGKLCNTKNVDTKEQLQALLADKSGKEYYEEMNHLDVDRQKLWGTIQKTLFALRFMCRKLFLLPCQQ